MDLGRISLRERERGFLVGGTGVGKSWLAEALVVDFHRRYPTGRVLILDTKPRFRVSHHANGRSAAKRFKRWGHGAQVPGGVLVSEPDELAMAWDTGARIAVAQSADVDAHDPRTVDEIAGAFYAQSRAGRPQLLFVDEAMDFYRQNGSPVSPADSIRRTARAGRERGCGLLLCSQRTKGIPAQLMEELTKLYLFRIDYLDDVKRLREMGAPATIAPPTAAREFVYWTKQDYRRTYGPFKLETPRRGAPASGASVAPAAGAR